MCSIGSIQPEESVVLNANDIQDMHILSLLALLNVGNEKLEQLNTNTIE